MLVVSEVLIDDIVFISFVLTVKITYHLRIAAGW
jgi:hypothetical protein